MGSTGLFTYLSDTFDRAVVVMCLDSRFSSASVENICHRAFIRLVQRISEHHLSLLPLPLTLFCTTRRCIVFPASNHLVEESEDVRSHYGWQYLRWISSCFYSLEWYQWYLELHIAYLNKWSYYSYIPLFLNDNPLMSLLNL